MIREQPARLPSRRNGSGHKTAPRVDGHDVTHAVPYPLAPDKLQQNRPTRTNGNGKLRQIAGARALPPKAQRLAVAARAQAPTHPRSSLIYWSLTVRSRRKTNRRGYLGYVTHAIISALFVGLLASVILLFATGIAAAAGYVAVANEANKLPSPDELVTRAASFQDVQIYDRNGSLLYELVDPYEGRRVKVPLDQISPTLIEATIATEDKTFYSNPGFDLPAIMRAFLQNSERGEAVSGASTITQQLARMLLLSEEERTQRTVERKLKEIYLAAELTRRYSKDQILEMYLNELYYGNLAYGAQAAAQTYFHQGAKDLNLAEASLLAGLPQAPMVYDPFTNPDVALERQKEVLALMVENHMVSPVEADAAVEEMSQRIRTLQPPRNDIPPAPHFVNYVRQVLEEQFGAQAIYRGGLHVKTTLDPKLQALAEEIVRTHVDQLVNRHVSNGALVAIDPATGEILAMVGSKDFNDKRIDGEVNIALRPRQPGSSIKLVTYLTALEMGWTPATIILDIPTTFPGWPRPYRPVDYDGKFHGPLPLRSAFANSYNVPAVKTLQFVGIPRFLETAKRLGITTLTRSDYGLSLTLGGGEVKLLELTAAYAVIANKGVRIPPTPILEITRSDGQVMWQHEAEGDQVARPQHAYLLTSILSDNAARTPAFGANSPLKLSRPAAAKTGTTDDFRDNWTIGFTPDLVVGVWVGNSDNTPMVHSTGITGAAPIWHDFMEKALAGRPVQDFAVPPGIVRMRWNGRMEVFAADQLPKKSDQDLWSACSDLSAVQDQDLRNWLEQNCPKPQATPQPAPQPPSPEPTPKPPKPHK